MKMVILMLPLALTVVTCLGVLAASASASPGGRAPRKSFASFTMDKLAKQRAESGQEYLSFFANDTLHSGVYVLAKGGVDHQSPHSEDELYHITKGKAKFTAGDETVDVAPGAVLFVAAGIPHRFHDIEQDLEILVFFSKCQPGD